MGRSFLDVRAQLLFACVTLTCVMFASACTSSAPVAGERTIADPDPTETSGDDPETAAPGPATADEPDEEPDPNTNPDDPDPNNTDPDEPGPRVVELGAAAGRRAGQTPIDALVTVETVADRQVEVLRSYAFWDSEFPNLRQQWASDGGRTLHLSVNARREDGTVVPWESIASAVPGTRVHDELMVWADRIAAFDGPLRLTFHHEADIEPEFGTPAEFRAAWQRFADVINDAAPDIPLVWVMTLFTMSRPDDVELFWPGDDYVDWIAADAFNWFGCRGASEDWRSPELLLDPLINYGLLHPGKPLMFAEIGSDEDPDDPGRKAAWLDELSELLAEDRYAAIETIVFFHNDHDDESTCDWWIDSSPRTAEAFRRFSSGELVGGPAALPAPASCPIVATTLGRDDDRAVVDGDGDGRYDFVFGVENRFLGIGDQANDGSDHRAVLHFDALEPLPAGATVELRVRVGSRQPALRSPVELVVFEGIPSLDRDAFTEPGTLIDAAWFDASTVGGHHVIDVTGDVDTTTPTTFRLQLAEIPPNDDGKTPLFIGMGDATRQVDRPALVVRSCG
jgi:hypothetical protein